MNAATDFLEKIFQGLAVTDWIGRRMLDGKETRRKMFEAFGAARARGRERFRRTETLACTHNRHEKRRGSRMRFAGKGD